MPDIPTPAEFLRKCAEYRAYERRDAMYKVASFVVEQHWGKPADMANGLGVLLLTWNNAFYRYGIFDFDRLESCVRANLDPLTRFRKRDFLPFRPEDEPEVRRLFMEFLDALRIDGGKAKGRRSPVGVAKTLHLLAPRFFPVWEDKIAKAYGCAYAKDPAGKYLQFCGETMKVAQALLGLPEDPERSLVKRIDEFNYATYTMPFLKSR